MDPVERCDKLITRLQRCSAKFVKGVPMSREDEEALHEILNRVEGNNWDLNPDGTRRYPNGVFRIEEFLTDHGA